MKKEKIKVVILCGGGGTRLREETEIRPKPLIEIGNRPILWHIMKIYSHYGFKDFVLCLGYKGDMIKDYFLNYEAMNNDFTINLGNRNNIVFHNAHLEKDWNVTLVNTGGHEQTGARIKRIEKYIDGETFMVTYGDGVGNMNIRKLLEFHQKNKNIGTLTAVHPSSRFGELRVKGKNIVEFNEKPLVSQGFISGGFFVFNKKFFRYLSNDDNCSLEREPLKKLVADGQLSFYRHDGFWQCMDTQRELILLSDLWKKNKASWKIWKY
jgi:glucose-1-phosphate cytidylyltransferase